MYNLRYEFLKNPYDKQISLADRHSHQPINKQHYSEKIYKKSSFRFL